MMKENYNTPNSGCCGRPFPTAPENKCNYNDCCMNEYAYKQKACIREKQPDCEAQAVIPSITVETVDGITNLANCLVHVTSTNTTYYVDDKHRIMITWAGPVNIPGYDMETNPNHYKNQIVTDTQAETAVIYDNNGNGFIFGITSSNLQTAINNKLDEMTSDGTLADIITPLLEPFEEEIREEIAGMGDLTKLETVEKDTLVNAINSANLNDIEYYRRKYSNNYRLFTDKGGVQYFNNVTIYKDIYDGSFNYQIDIESFKNSGGSSIYVNPATTESASVQNGTLEHPYNSVLKAYNVASDGDTIWLFDGIYYRTNCNLGSTTYLDKNVNLLPYQTGKVYFFNGDKLSFTQNATYSNVYQATRSNTVCAYDIRYRDDDIFPLLTLVSSLDACAATLNSYYTSGSTVYVNIGEQVTSEKVIFGLNIGNSMLQIRPSTSNIKVYIEGITGCGGDYGIFDIASASGYTCEVIANKCNFYYSFNDSSNAISVKGANTIFKDCKACFGARDGFNYHKQGAVLCNSIELDCVGANNGLITTQNNNNGSTTHDGNKCLRINGVYFNNRGGNVTDVQTNTYSLNINCAAFDSKSSGTTSKGDFIAQQAGVTMDLYNCYSKGSSSYVNIYGVADTTMNVHNCLFDNAYSDGTININ